MHGVFVYTVKPVSRNPSFPICRHPCKSLSRRKKILLTRASEERARRTSGRTRSSHVWPLGSGSRFRRTGHPFAVSGPCGPSQKIESVFSASPETIRREPREFYLRRSVGNRRTWQSARYVILLFFARGPRFLGRCTPRICEGDEVALPPIHGEQIRHHFSSYG
jgi:hypothetical protein